MVDYGWSRRNELTITEAYQSYRQRYDIEHLLRLVNKNYYSMPLLLPKSKHEENWVQLIFLAYVQLWAARKLALTLPRPWERYLPQKPKVSLLLLRFKEI